MAEGSGQLGSPRVLTVMIQHEEAQEQGHGFDVGSKIQMFLWVSCLGLCRSFCQHNAW